MVEVSVLAAFRLHKLKRSNQHYLQEKPTKSRTVVAENVGKILDLRGVRRMGAPTTSILRVAEAFLARQNMDHKKLQKLCYYAYAWYLVLFNKTRLFEERFQAWIHGPVNPDLYQAYRSHGWEDIPKRDTLPDLPERILQHVDNILEAYGGLSGNELESLAHSEEPWRRARRGLEDWQPSTMIIDDADMFSYYQAELAKQQSE